MIKTTIEGLLMTRPILQELTNIPLSAKESFKVYRTLKSLEKEYELIASTQSKMLEKYGAKDADGNYISDGNGNVAINNDLAEAFYKEMEQFLHAELELNVDKFSLSILDYLTVTPGQMLYLESFIEE